MAEPTQNPPAPPVSYDDIIKLHERFEALRGEMREQLQAGDQRMGSIEQEMRANTAVTTEVRDLLNTWRAGMTVAGLIGKGAVWIRNIILAGLALVGLWHAVEHGTPPPPHK